MRGDEEHQDAMIVFESLEDQVPPDHPLRPIRRMVDRALAEMSPLFDSLYVERARVSIREARALRVTPHVAEKRRYSALDGRTTGET